MRFAVFGAGAIGGFLAARLIEGGEEVVLIARGAHLKALREGGLRVESEVFGSARYEVEATDDPSKIGAVDCVILSLKAHGLTAAADSIASLLSPETVVLSTQNGLPWWYFHGVEGESRRLESVDPGGRIAAHIPLERAVGAIVYISAGLPEPGKIHHLEGIRLPLGEPDGSRSERIKRLSEAFRKGGLKAPIRGDIRHELWVKLLGNGIFNPLSALTRKTLREMAEHAPTRDVVRAAMEEIRETAAAAGVRIAFSTEKRIEGAREAGYHKTSMLQDLESGRPPELGPLVGGIVELAEMNNVEVPTLRAVYAATSLLFEKPRG